MYIELRRVSKTYVMKGGLPVPALREATIDIATGDFVALMGPSGCGKTTLLSVIGLLTQANDGDYRLDGRDVRGMSRHEYATFRAESIGFIFQSYNLLPRETAWRNVMLPLTFRSMYRSEREARAREVLNSVGLAHRSCHYPFQMSGGEQQRVSIARALVNRPKLIVADEPTGNLDSRTGDEIMQLILAVAKEHGTTVIIATHDAAVAARARRVIRMRDGSVITDERRE